MRMWKRQIATNTRGGSLEVKMSQVDSLRDSLFYCSSLYIQTLYVSVCTFQQGRANRNKV